MKQKIEWNKIKFDYVVKRDIQLLKYNIVLAEAMYASESLWDDV